MNPIVKLVTRFSESARAKRARLFLRFFTIDCDTKILDLGSEDGRNIHKILDGTGCDPNNVYIADIDPKIIQEGRSVYGFNAVPLDESGRLPFPDQYFDIVYCSSVIEHVTVPKAEVWRYSDTAGFKRDAVARQTLFAGEIARVGKQYFVQTPCRSFPIESHSWLPLIGYLPRNLLLPTLMVSNRFWVKVTIPDFHLLGPKDMNQFFPGAEIVLERTFGLTKSIMAVKAGS